MIWISVVRCKCYHTNLWSHEIEHARWHQLKTYYSSKWQGVMLHTSGSGKSLHRMSSAENTTIIFFFFTDLTFLLSLESFESRKKDETVLGAFVCFARLLAAPPFSIVSLIPTRWTAHGSEKVFWWLPTHLEEEEHLSIREGHEIVHHHSLFPFGSIKSNVVIWY